MTITKELLKKEIDKLPDEMVGKVYKLLGDIKKTKKVKKNLTFHLGGQFDNINVREYAYRKNSR